jgi:hypothetical protein
VLTLYLLLVAVTVLTGWLTQDGRADWVPAWLRGGLAVAFAFVVPGLPVSLALRLGSRALVVALTVTITWSVVIVTSLGSIVVPWWHPAVLESASGLVGIVPVLWVWRRGAGCWPARGVLGRRSLLERSRVLPGAMLAVSFVLFCRVVVTFDPARSDATGVIRVLGPGFFVGLAVVVAVIAGTLVRRRIDGLVLSAASAVLLLYLTATVSLADGAVSPVTAFVHRGFAQLLADTGQLPPPTDARFSWAGFFTAVAHLTSIAGLNDSSALMVLFPVVINLVSIPALLVIGRVITGSTRLAWLGVFLFFGFNWYQQDYFSPQAIAFVLYITIVAVLLFQLQVAPAPPTIHGRRFTRLLAAVRRTIGRASWVSPNRSLGVELCLLLLITTVVVSHQLTPFTVIGALVCFTITGTTRYRLMWLAAGLVFTAWFSYGAIVFWQGHLSEIIGGLGQVGTSLDSGVSNRLAGDPLYRRMQYLRILCSMLIFGLGMLGWWRTRGRRAWVVGGLVATMPFALVAVQVYGGEVLIRSFLFASALLAPYAARMAATLLVGRRSWRRARPRMSSLRRRTAVTFRTAVLGAALFACCLAVTTNRWLNASFERTSAEQVVDADEVIDTIPDGTTILTWTTNPAVLTDARLLDFRVDIVDFEDCLPALARCTLTAYPDLVWVPSEGIAVMQYQFSTPPRVVQAQIDDLLRSGKYVVALRTDDLTVLRRADFGASLPWVQQ